MSSAKKKSDDTPDPQKPDEIISEIDSYQEKIAEDWETTKSNYQSKINQILEDFIKEKTSSEGDTFSILLPNQEKKQTQSKLRLPSLQSRTRAFAPLKTKSGCSPTTKTQAPRSSTSTGDRTWNDAGSTKQKILIGWFALGGIGRLSASWLFLPIPAATTKLPYAHPERIDGV
jgi:hypothetical protein